MPVCIRYAAWRRGGNLHNCILQEYGIYDKSDGGNVHKAGSYEQLMKQDQPENRTQKDNFRNADLPFKQQNQVNHADNDCSGLIAESTT